VLFAGRRPGGDPPAWRTGRAEPWQTAQQAAEARKAQQEADEPPAPDRPEEPEPVPAGAHPAASRRKRKRRT
jgi:hypothetical protein